MKTFLAIFAIVSVFNVRAEFPNPIRAIAVVIGPDSNIRGNVTFTQSGCDQPVVIELSITGLLIEGKRGFHIHETGDLSNGCTSLGAHYNPNRLHHGGPADDVRHVGDLGNIGVNASGLAKTIFTDYVLSLTGSRSIIGRGVIVHYYVDDLGRGGDEMSLITGNAGGRAACGVIGLTDEATIPECNSANIISSILVTFLTPIVILLHLR